MNDLTIVNADEHVFERLPIEIIVSHIFEV